MSEINVKQIRKAAELLGMKPKDLIVDKKITVDAKLITADIKSYFEEKVERLLKFNQPSLNFQTLIEDLYLNFTSFRIHKVCVVGIMLLFLIGLLYFIGWNYLSSNWDTTKDLIKIVIILFTITTLMLSILIFAWMFCIVIYYWITEKKSPQLYAVEELVKIIDIIDKQEKY
ncbi:hypothetical protein [Candidatus Marithrix sp. Canyon 246]|uniref:hypothetical protein n=1 Tax=Candidatus Marithrix sp. Canyon 246 TaxID=1827136 RepID=UPI00084A27F4|nr:hypothetical protein [Candidatus Marithrix sp. Canyon 246]